MPRRRFPTRCWFQDGARFAQFPEKAGNAVGILVGRNCALRADNSFKLCASSRASIAHVLDGALNARRGTTGERTSREKRHEAEERDVPLMVDDGNGGGRGAPVRPGRHLPQCPARRAPAWQRRAAHPGRLRLPDLRGPRQMRRPAASALPGRSRHHTTRHGLPTRQRRVLLGPVIRVITTSTVRQKWIVEAAVPGKALSSDQAERIRTWG